MPKSYPDFPHHTQIAAYFDDYVDHFGFRDRIRFETGVEHAELGTATACWRVRLDERRERTATTPSLVANGHHWDPRWPEPPLPRERSTGAQMHAHDYTRPRTSFRGQARRRPRHGQQRDGHRRRVVLRGRRAHVPRRAARRVRDPEVPLRAAARPARARARRLLSLGGPPGAMASRRRCCSRGRRRWSTTGCPSPTTGSARRTRRSPAASSTASPTARSRRSRTSPSSRATASRSSTAREVEADVIVYCTGYKVTFPFFDEDFISAPDNDLPLYRRVFHPEHRGPVLRRARSSRSARSCRSPRRQGQWIADYLRGEYALPPTADLLRGHAHGARARCSSATSRPSATRCRSTSTTTCTRSTGSAGAAPSARGRRASGCRSRPRAAEQEPVAAA